MLFTLTNVPYTFQSFMNEVFKIYLRKSMLVFFDDILIYSQRLEVHKEHSQTILQLLRDSELVVNLKNYNFGEREVEYLAHVVSKVSQNIWILDFETTDHMTPFPSFFTSYIKVSKKQLITIANGDHVPIVESGNVQLRSSLFLHNVTTPIRRIFLPVNGKPQKLGQLLKFGFTINILDIYLLGYLRLFPHLFTKESVESFNCDICQFSKHHHTTFSPSNHKSFVPFDLIHFNKFEICQTFVDFFHLVQNQVAERKNHHLLEVARALLFQMCVPNLYWEEAALTVTYFINKLPTPVLNGISSIKHILSFFPSSPLMLSLPSHVFVYVAFVHSHNPHRGKLDPRIVKCVFIGYPSNKKGFKCYHPPSCRVLVSMDVTFHETKSFFVSPPLQGESYLELEFSFIVVIDTIQTPTSVQETLKDENWVQVMKEKIKTLEKNSTWEIVDRSKNKRVVGCRWIYTVKCKSNGTLDRYKARLVAKGYTQTYGIDYEETFVPVAKMNTARVILFLTNHFGWNLQ
ncbi:putative mitochondrial protein, partial [Mucuna pruriens]